MGMTKFDKDELWRMVKYYQERGLSKKEGVEKIYKLTHYNKNTISRYWKAGEVR